MTGEELTLLLAISEKVHGPSVKDQSTFNVWYELVKEVPVEEARRNLLTHLRSSPFPPKPSDIVGDFYNKPRLSIYDIQALEQQEEQLALQEYHESNEVILMPDHIREKLERLSKKRTLGGAEGLE